MMDGKFETTLKEMNRRTQMQCAGGMAQSKCPRILKETWMWERLWGERLDIP